MFEKKATLAELQYEAKKYNELRERVFQTEIRLASLMDYLELTETIEVKKIVKREGATK